MGSILAIFSTPARLQGLIIAAGVMIVMMMSLTIWALWEQSGRHQAETEAATMKAQSQALADSLGRCNAGVEAAAKAGQLAVGETRRLLGMAETALLKTAALREEARAIVGKPAPVRADGKIKDCSDALAEIRKRVQP